MLTIRLPAFIRTDPGGASAARHPVTDRDSAVAPIRGRSGSGLRVYRIGRAGAARESGVILSSVN
jgi:hypothetical protein